MAFCRTARWGVRWADQRAEIAPIRRAAGCTSGFIKGEAKQHGMDGQGGKTRFACDTGGTFTDLIVESPAA
jgi:hypothetical protein